MSLVAECSIMKEMARSEEDIKVLYERLKVMENKLLENEVSDDVAKRIRTEVNEVRKLLGVHEEKLNQLRKRNRKSFLFVVALSFIIFTIYMVYVLLGGDDL